LGLDRYFPEVSWANDRWVVGQFNVITELSENTDFRGASTARADDARSARRTIARFVAIGRYSGTPTAPPHLSGSAYSGLDKGASSFSDLQAI
jgi:hypothetical protein